MPPGANTCSQATARSCTSVPTTRKTSSRKRLEVYQTQTQPLIDHYSKLGLLRVVAGEGALEEVFERMEAAALAKPVPADKVKVTTRKARACARKRAAVRARRRRPRASARSEHDADEAKRRKSAKRVAKRKTARTRRCESKLSRQTVLGRTAHDKSVGLSPTYIDLQP